MARFLAGVLIPLAIGLAVAAVAAAEEPVEARITYVTTTTVYVDAGTEAGLRTGDVVKVFQEGLFVTALEVTAVSSKRAACRRADPSVALEVGNAIRFRPAPPEETAAPSLSSGGSSRSGRGSGWLRQHGFRGRIGLRTIGLVDDSGLDGGYTEPAIDARVVGTLSRTVSVSIDARARRTYRPGENVSRTRIYRLNGAWTQGPTGPQVVLGRQFSGSLASISVFDGVLGRYRGMRWSAGLFAGSQPDPITYGFSNVLREYGAFAEWTEHPDGGVRWRLTLAAVGSYHEGTINREYLALQARWTGRRFMASAIQEVDLNRGWKADVGEDPVTLTSSYASARFSLNRMWAIDGGVDTRRTVRQYRDLVTPETEFDDSYRQGYWGGFAFRPAARVRLSASARRSTGGSAGTADSFTGVASAGLASLRGLDARVRGTFYRNDSADGRLVSLGVAADALSRLRVGADLGRRTETIRITGAADDIDWFSVDLDFPLTRAWLLLASSEWTRVNREKTTQYYASAVYRF